MDRLYKYNAFISHMGEDIFNSLVLRICTSKIYLCRSMIVFKLNFQTRAVRVEDQRFIDWDHYKFTLWQTQLNFAVFCASSACGVSIKHMNAKKPMIRSIYGFHVYYHIRRILKLLEIPLPYENSFNQYNNLYNHEKFIGICNEYGVSNDLTNWRNQKYFSTWQSRAWETGKPGMSYINENSDY